MSTVHVYPPDDVVEHDTEGDDCWCGPELEAVFTDDGSNGWLITHHSVDGREFEEPEPPTWILHTEGGDDDQG